MTTGLPIIAVPTTYAGSEATNVWGLTEAARKTTGVDDRVLPVTVIYDAALTLSLPVDMSVASGLNGMAHCIDSMWAPRADPINAGPRRRGHPRPRRRPAADRRRPVRDRRPRTGPLRRLPLRRRVRLGRVRAAPQDLPRPRRHLQPAARPDPRHRAALRAGLQRPDCPGGRSPHRRGLRHRRRRSAGLQELREHLDAPKALSDYGFTAEEIAEAVAVILPAVPASNPRPSPTENLTRLLAAALTGEDPTVLLDL